ncbi:hypothetical protein LJC60_09460 [Ruminococcaceae bacterium OttesenSCG-928-D13]|nr:hypothetical protein [Ruminococcaceae bacterium OttesenSCG-928-D13]
MLTVDGQRFNIEVVEVVRKADFLDKYAERTEDGGLERELIGVYFNYQLKLGSGASRSEYARLWNKLTEPEEFHTVVVPDENGDYTFTAYFSNVSDRLLRQADSRNYFTDLTVNFTAKAPARR